MPLSLTASGSAIATASSAPSIISKRAVKLTASGTASATGKAVAASHVLPLGGLTDFAVWGSTQPDPAMSRDLAHAVGADASTGRGWLAASAPSEYSRAGGPALWKAAVYAGVGIKWTGMPAGQSEAFQQVQFERAYPTANRLSWEATSWETRRCYVAQGNVHWATVASSSDTAFSGKQCGKITYLGAPAGTWGYWIDPVTPTGMTPCVPGEKLNGSVSLQMSRAAWFSAGLQFYDASYNQIGNWYYSQRQQHPGGNQWFTGYVVGITAPASAAYVAVVPHISINSTPTATDSIAPVGEVAYCDMHRVWSSPYNVLNTPTTYTAPRKLTIDVAANRVNLINNPGFDKDSRGWGAFGTGAAPFPASWDSVQGRQKAGSFKFTVAGNIGAASGVSTRIGVSLLTAWSSNNVGGFGWKPNTLYTVSAYVKRAPDCPHVNIGTGGYPALGGVLSTADATNHPELVDGDWVRIWGTLRTSSADDGLVGTSLGITTADVTATGLDATFWVDDVLCEEGDRLSEYFDGNSPGSDYLWSGTPGYSTSHYYPEFRSSAYRLRDIVQSQVPHGTQIDIRYARPPQ